MGTGASTQALEKAGRRIPRTRTIGVRVTEQEYLTLESEAWKAGKTVADWARDQILGRPRFHGVSSLDGHLFTELVGIQLLLMNTLGRIPVCGFISGYNSGHSNISNLSNIIYSRVMLRGFVAPDFMHLWDDFKRDMAGWLKDGKVKYQETIRQMDTRTGEGKATADLTLEIADLKHLEKVTRSIAGLEGVMQVERKFNVRHATA